MLFVVLVCDGINKVVFIGFMIVPLVVVEWVVAFVVEKVFVFVTCEKIIKYNQPFEPM